MLTVARQFGDKTNTVSISSLPSVQCCVMCLQLIVALEGIRAVMEIHFRAIDIGGKQICWFTTWDLSQVVQNFEIILAAVFTKSSKTDIACLEKVHKSKLQDVCTLSVHFPCVSRSTVSCVILLGPSLQHHFMVSLRYTSTYLSDSIGLAYFVII